MNTESIMALGGVLVVVTMFVIYATVMPESKYKSLSPFGKWLSDTFNFRTLWLENILKFLYVLATVTCVIFGILVIFEGMSYGIEGIFRGLVMILLGTVGVRLAFEGFMLLILLVKNVMQINKRLMVKEDGKAPEPLKDAITSFEPVKEPVGAYTAPVASNNNQSQKKVCSNCGTPVSGNNSVFCPNCGTRL